MKSMKLSKKQANETMQRSEIEAPQYPWGLRIELNDESMQKLGLKSLPSVGKKMILCAMVEVVSVSENEHHGQKKRQQMSLQITDMEIEEKSEKKNPASTLYGEDE